MEIRNSNNQLSRINSSVNGQSNPKQMKPKKITNTEDRDNVKLSRAGRDFNFAMNKIKEEQEVRSELVEKYKNEIKSGNYKINSLEIAKRMIGKF